MTRTHKISAYQYLWSGHITTHISLIGSVRERERGGGVVLGL